MVPGQEKVSRPLAAVGFGSGQMAIYERPLAAGCRDAELFPGLNGTC